MDESSLAERIARLASEAERLANTIYLDENVPAERTRRHAQRLRETLGTALVLSERLGREAGNGNMVEFRQRSDGSGEASFAVNLKDTDLLEWRPGPDRPEIEKARLGC